MMTGGKPGVGTVKISCRFNPLESQHHHNLTASFSFQVQRERWSHWASFIGSKSLLLKLCCAGYTLHQWIVGFCLALFQFLNQNNKSKYYHWIFLLEGRLATWLASPCSDANCKFRNCISNIIYGKDGKECELWFWVIFKRQLMHMLFWNRAICLEIIWVWPRRLLPINSNNLKWYANFINLIFIKN